jgi:rod shape determining protein RodA
MPLLKRTNFLYKVDWALVASAVFLSCLGLAAIYSVALGRGDNEFGNFQKQIMFLVYSLPLMLVVSFVDYRLWRNISWVGYGLSIILMVLVLTPLGSDINGARGWFDFGFFSFQPVELVKVFLILVMADICSRYTRTIYKWRHLIFMGLVAAVPLLLAVVQPDFGSAMVLFFIWLVAFLLVVKNKWQVILIFGSVIALALFAWFFVLQDYQKARINSFINPALDPQGRGYNVRQSIIAVGAGKFLGRGLGFGSQSQLKFIPESQTDFIFAVIAEEIGFVGVAIAIFLFSLLFWRFYNTAIRAPDDFGMFIVLLTSAMVFFHVFINMGMCVGLLPVTGISLPFVSYGGSFLLTMMLLLGMILSVYRYGNNVRSH